MKNNPQWFGSFIEKTEDFHILPFILLIPLHRNEGGETLFSPICRKRRWSYHGYVQTIDIANLITDNTTLANRLNPPVLVLRRFIVTVRYPPVKYHTEIKKYTSSSSSESFDRRSNCQIQTMVQKCCSNTRQGLAVNKFEGNLHDLHFVLNTGQ
jgi:hypothetical protein